MRVSLFLVGVAEMDDPDDLISFADLPVELENLLEGDLEYDNQRRFSGKVFKIDYVKEVPVAYPDLVAVTSIQLWRDRAEKEALDIMVGIADIIKGK